MSTRHLVTRAREYLQHNSNSAQTACSQHISPCQYCQNCNLDVSSFEVIRHGYNENETNIEKALLIKKKTNTTIELTVIRQRLLFLVECVLILFFYTSVVYTLPHAVRYFGRVASFFSLFFLT